MKKWFLVSMVLFVWVFFQTGCRRILHRECRSNYQINTGEIQFVLVNNCLSFSVTGDTNVYTRSGQWDSMWAEKQKSIGGNCPAPIIDFATSNVLTFHQTFSSSQKIMRNVTFDHTAKKVVLTITKFKCKSRIFNTKELGISDNLIVINKIPAGYSVEYVSISEQ